jgi:hypothetical protein
MKRPSEEELKKYHVNYKPDTNFTAHSRLLQSKWRVAKGLKMNDKSRSNYGNFIETESAIKYKSNYITENIKTLVGKKVNEIKRQGGLVGEPRIWNNLLSSQPLCFNLFGELYYDLKLATKLFKKLFPDKLDKVTKIDFEYSSKRNNPDNSAFDVYVEYELNGVQKFFGIEVKYQENLKEESNKKAALNFEKHKEKYIQLTADSGYFKPNVLQDISRPPYAQIWRDHLLSFNMSTSQKEGYFIYLYPFQNDECNQGVNDYKRFLVDEYESRFFPIDLDYCIRTLNEIHPCSWTTELIERYLGN